MTVATPGKTAALGGRLTIKPAACDAYCFSMPADLASLSVSSTSALK